MPKPSESPRSFVSMTKLLGGLSYGRAKMITALLRQKNTNKKGQMPMGNVSYSAHISNGKSAITIE